MNGIDYYQGQGALYMYETKLPWLLGSPPCTSASRTVLTGELSRRIQPSPLSPEDRELGFHLEVNRSPAGRA